MKKIVLYIFAFLAAGCALCFAQEEPGVDFEEPVAEVIPATPAWQTLPIQKNLDGSYLIWDAGARYQVCGRDIDPLGVHDITEVADFWESLPEGNANKLTQRPEDLPQAPVLTLEEAKTKKKEEIDKNTDRIKLRDGLSYQGERFSLTSDAMIKWTGLMAAKEILPYPVTILTIDEKPFALANEGAVMAFVASVLLYETSADSALLTGRALRARVEAAQTIEEVDAIEDDRE